MCGMLDNYLRAFSKLRVDSNRKSWTDSTTFRSPYKPFLLLAVIDHIADGTITSNFIEPSIELTETWNGYIALLPPMSRQASMAYPFYYLKSEGFWHLRHRADTDIEPIQPIKSIKQLRKIFYGAILNDDLFPLLQMPASREKLRSTLIQTYFSAEIRPRLEEQAVLNYQSSEYSNELLAPKTIVPPPTTSEQTPPALHNKARDQGFRKAIVRLYDHRCALCGIRIITEENHSIVDAAHIVPWAKSRDDRPTNGMALCKLCHWSFDVGLMAVGKEYEVLVSPSVKHDANLPGHILALSDRPIFRPSDSTYWPAHENFKWHRNQRFKKSY